MEGETVARGVDELSKEEGGITHGSMSASTSAADLWAVVILLKVLVMME